jgi:hypothetical protein
MASIFANHTQEVCFYANLIAHKSIKNNTKVLKTSAFFVSYLPCPEPASQVSGYAFAGREGSLTPE